MIRIRRLAACAVALFVSIGVGPGRPWFAVSAAPGPERAGPVEPHAATWKTWVLSSPRQFRPVAPPADSATVTAELKTLHDLAPGRNARTRVQIEFWSAGGPLYRWDRIALDESLSHLVNNSRGARVLALVSVAIYDAIIAAWDAKYAYNRTRPSIADPTLTTAGAVPRSPSYPSEHAVVAGAASAVLAYLFPDDAERLNSLAVEDGHAQLLAGIQYPSDVTIGLQLGRRVGALVIERAKSDGSDTVLKGQLPTGPGYWKGTDPIEPMMGTWRTWALRSGSQFRPGPPPAYDSEQTRADLTEIKDFPRTAKSNDAAMFWQFAVAGTRGYYWWHEHVGEQIALQGLDNDPPRAARAYAMQSVTQYDAVVACWDAKYTYWRIRPPQLDPDVKTLFPPPNHPSYPAAHACQSGANAVILSYLFPSEAARFAALAQQAGESRIWAAFTIGATSSRGPSWRARSLKR